MKSPKVSVGLPTYNRPHFLARALENLQNQTYKNVEVIVSDDCFPNDENKKVCDSFIQRGLNLKYHRPERNLGGPNNHKRVLDLADGKYFFWGSDDDLWDKDFILFGVNTLEKNPRIDGWSPSYVNTDSEGNTLRTYPPITRFSSTSIKAFDLFRFLIEPESLGRCVLVHGIFRTDPLKEYANNYFWNRGAPWMDNSFMYGFISRMDILCTQDVMLYKTVFPAKNDKTLSIDPPYAMTWRDHYGPPLNEYFLFAKEHAKAAGSNLHSLIAYSTLLIRYFIDVGFLAAKKAKRISKRIFAF